MPLATLSLWRGAGGEVVQFRNGNQIKNKYDAGGQKLSTDFVTRKIALLQPLQEGQIIESYTWREVTISTVTYVGNMERNGGSLRIYNTEGYATLGDSYVSEMYHYYRRDHLGNNREVWRAPYTVYVANNTVVPAETVQRTQYYPSGLPWSEGTGQALQNRKYNGKEWIEAHGLDETDLGNRSLYHAINRFTRIDRFSEKYPWQSPYVFAANNPVNYVDVNGDSIWYTRKENVITMHVTGKVINQSGDDININRAASDIASGIDDAFSGEIEYGEKTYTLQTDIQLEAVTSMDNVKGSDHLFVLGDSDGKSARGVTNILGGKVMTIASSDYANNNWFSNTFISNNTRTAVHEFGHAVGLNHVSGVSNIFNLMQQGGFGSNISPSQRGVMIDNWNKINKGSNSYMKQPYPFVHDPNTGAVYRANDLLNWHKRYGR